MQETRSKRLDRLDFFASLREKNSAYNDNGSIREGGSAIFLFSFSTGSPTAVGKPAEGR